MFLVFLKVCIFFTRGSTTTVLQSTEYPVRPSDTSTHSSSMFANEAYFKIIYLIVKQMTSAQFFQHHWIWNCNKNLKSYFCLLSITSLHLSSPFAESKEEHISTSLVFLRSTKSSCLSLICGLRVLCGKLWTVTRFHEEVPKWYWAWPQDLIMHPPMPHSSHCTIHIQSARTNSLYL